MSKRRSACSSRDSARKIERPGEGDGRHRQVDQEGPTPGGVRRQPAADERPQRGHAADHRAPDAERDAALAPAELRGDERERRRQDRGAADALQQPGDDQQSAGGGQAGEEGRAGEDDEPAQEDPAPTDQVAQPAERHQQRGEDQAVDGVDPLGGGEVDPQVLDDHGDRDVHDRDVDDDHRDAQAEHAQADPAVAVSGHGPSFLCRHSTSWLGQPMSRCSLDSCHEPFTCGAAGPRAQHRQRAAGRRDGRHQRHLPGARAGHPGPGADRRPPAARRPRAPGRCLPRVAGIGRPGAGDRWPRTHA